MEYPSYTYPVVSLHTGSSLGNLLTFARLSAGTDLQDLWSSLDDEFYAGEWRIEFLIDGTILEPSETLFRPESQETMFRGNGTAAGITIGKRFFLPFPGDRRSRVPPSSLQAAIFLISFASDAREIRQVVIRHTLSFPARSTALFTKQPPEHQASKRVEIRRRERAFEVLTAGKPNEARLVGSSLTPQKHAATDESLTMEYELPLHPGKTAEASFILAYSTEGVEAARDTYLRCRNVRALLEESVAGYSALLSTSEILTPEPVINRGLRWAKVNSVRVQHRYRTGEAFTNDPPQDIVVIRDLAWYVFGSDYLTPEFSHNLLALAERLAFHEDGKLTEFLHANEAMPGLHDYGLNINDDTPLYVIALYHHALVCKEKNALARAWPLIKRACDHILTQVEDGLIRCHSGGTNVWGICGWRNIIDGYNLTGAVTEINSECFAALRCAAEAGAHLGETEDAESYARQARLLRDAINSRLVSEETGLYLLNLSDDGTRHHDITGDLVLPVFFGVADAAMRGSILRKLTAEEFWTPYGARTVSKREHNYDPDFGYQLMGGVWPNLTAWIAFCLRHEQPAKLVEGMLNIYKVSEPERPADFVNVVPGEFPERLNGESYISRGMAMSPWMPPTYVWLGIEGLLGVHLSLDGLHVNPCIPPGWSWIAVRNLPYKGLLVTMFLHEGVLYSNYPVKSPLPVRTGTLMETTTDADTVMCIGLKIGENIVVFAASDRESRATITVHEGSRKIVEPVHLGPGGARLIDISKKRPQHEPAARER